MEDKLPTAQEAAIGFAKRMRPEDVIEVIGFSTQVRILQPFTNVFPTLERAIRATTADGSTALYNSIYISLKELRKIKAKSEEEIRRQAIVVLSDGDDTSSLLPYEEVLDLAKRSETAIYTIGLRPPDIGRASFKEAEYVLRQLAQETGGRSFFPTSRPRPAENLRGDFAGTVDALLCRLHLEEPAAEWRVAPRRRPRDASGAHHAHPAGLLRPDRALGSRRLEQTLRIHCRRRSG